MDALAKPAGTDRPLAISIVTALGFAWWAYAIVVVVMLRVFNVSEELIPLLVPRVGSGVIFFQMIFLGAIWRMQRWGLYGYIATVLYRAVVYYLTGQSMWWLIVPLFVIAVAALYYRRMQ